MELVGNICVKLIFLIVRRQTCVNGSDQTLEIRQKNPDKYFYTESMNVAI